MDTLHVSASRVRLVSHVSVEESALLTEKHIYELFVKTRVIFTLEHEASSDSHLVVMRL